MCDWKRAAKVHKNHGFLCTFGKKFRADVTFAFLGVSIIRDLKLAGNYLVPAWTIIGGTAVLTALNTCELSLSLMKRR